MQYKLANLPQLSNWTNAQYERNQKYLEQLMHKGSSGNYVRSKSESMIDMVLYIHKIPEFFRPNVNSIGAKYANQFCENGSTTVNTLYRPNHTKIIIIFVNLSQQTSFYFRKFSDDMSFQ